jgi:pilus assembly protein CpaF
MTWLKERFGVYPQLISPGMTSPKEDQDIQDLKMKLHYQVVGSLDLPALDSMPEDDAYKELEAVIWSLIDGEIKDKSLSPLQKNELVRGITNEVMGLGPLEPLLADNTLTEIMCNDYNKVYIERNGRIEKTAVRFRDNDHLRYIIDKIASAVDRRIDEMSPMVDARLKDGSRVNAIIPPLAINGPTLTIRKFSKTPYTVNDLINLARLHLK